jgi:Putative zinc-finger
MSSTADPYREWNGAYVLGSLPPSERREYEHHLSECPACTRAVASLAGMAGILSTVTAESAMALLTDDATSGGKGSPPDTLPKLLLAAERQRRRARVRVGVLVAVAATVAAVSAAIAVHPPSLNTGDIPAGRRDMVAMEQVIPSPVTADAVMTTGAWGTRIEGTCRYTRPSADTPMTASRPPGEGKTFAYALYITTKDGVSTEVASWTASPGSEVAFTATTKIPLEQISSVDIRLLDKSIVLLTTRL